MKRVGPYKVFSLRAAVLVHPFFAQRFFQVLQWVVFLSQPLDRSKGLFLPLVLADLLGVSEAGGARQRLRAAVPAAQSAPARLGPRTGLAPLIEALR